jgi:hypothetical protein
LTADTIPGGALQPVSVGIDLKDVQSGKYIGQLFVTDAFQNDLTIPIEISVKDDWFWPLVTLLIGALVGMGVSAYRTRGRQSDELNVRIEAVEREVDAAGSLQVALRPLVKPIVLEALAHASAKRWQEAGDAATRAETLVRRWRSEEDEWRAQLERKLVLVQSVRANLAKSELGRQLERQLDSIDLATLDSAAALGAELYKVDDQIRFFTDLSNLLAGIEKEIEEIRDDARKPFIHQLEQRRTDLRVLKANDQAGADALRKSARTLADDVGNALEQQAEMRDRFNDFARAADELRKQLSKTGANGTPVAEAGNDVLDTTENEPLERQVEWAENVWRGFWSARQILQLVTRSADSKEKKALLDWLSDPTVYRQSTADFTSALQPFEAAVRATWAAGSKPPSVPTPPRREKRAKGARRLDFAVALPNSSTESPDETNPPPPELKQPTSWRRFFDRRDLQASRWRLSAFKTGSFAIALGLLVWFGFNELYAAAPTFGADGTKDYLTLFLWGFGAEATRSAVTDLVKGLVPAT